MKITYTGESSIQLWNLATVAKGDEIDVDSATASTLIERDPHLWTKTKTTSAPAAGKE